MSNNDEHAATTERLSALVDGESTAPDADADWIRADDAINKQYRQYQTLGKLLRELPPPPVSDAFAANTASLITRRRRFRHYVWSLSAAAAALLVAGVMTIFMSPASDEAGEIIASRAPVLDTPPYDETDYYLWQLMNDAQGGMDMEDVMTLFDYVSEEVLVEALAMLAASVQLDEESPWHDGPLEMDYWTTPGAMPVVSIYVLMDSLDEVERIAVDNLLQDLLT